MARNTRSRTNPIAPNNLSGNAATNSSHGAIFVQGSTSGPEQEVSTPSANETSEPEPPAEPVAAPPALDSSAIPANISDNGHTAPVDDGPAQNSANRAPPMHDYHQPSTGDHSHWNRDTRADHPAPGPAPSYGNPSMVGYPPHYAHFQGRGYSHSYHPYGRHDGYVGGSGIPAALDARASPLSSAAPPFPTVGHSAEMGPPPGVPPVPNADNPGSQPAASQAPRDNYVPRDYSNRFFMNGSSYPPPNGYHYPPHGEEFGYHQRDSYDRLPSSRNKSASKSKSKKSSRKNKVSKKIRKDINATLASFTKMTEATMARMIQVVENSNAERSAETEAIVQAIVSLQQALPQAADPPQTVDPPQPSASPEPAPEATTTQTGPAPESQKKEAASSSPRPFRHHRIARMDMHPSVHTQSGNRVLSHNVITCINPPPSDMLTLFDSTEYAKRASLLKSEFSPDRVNAAQTLYDRCLLIHGMMFNLSREDLFVHIIPDPEFPITTFGPLLTADLGSLRSILIKWLPSQYVQYLPSCDLSRIRTVLRRALKQMWNIKIKAESQIGEFIANPTILQGYVLLALLLSESESKDEVIIENIVDAIKEELDRLLFFSQGDFAYLRTKQKWEFLDEYLLAQATHGEKFERALALHTTVQTAPYQPIVNVRQSKPSESNVPPNSTTKASKRYKRANSGGSQKQSQGTAPTPAPKAGTTPSKNTKAKNGKGKGNGKGQQINTVSVQEVLTVNDGNTLEARKAELNSQLS